MRAPCRPFGTWERWGALKFSVLFVASVWQLHLGFLNVAHDLIFLNHEIVKISNISVFLLIRQKRPFNILLLISP